MALRVLRRTCAGLAIGACAVSAATAGTPAAPAVVADAAKRIAAIAADPASRRVARGLWARPLDAPIAVHDPDGGGTWLLGKDKPVAVALPPGTLPANTCIELAGTRTALLVLPLPETQAKAARLVWHERWHCVQGALGLVAREGGNAHLDTESGRTWLRLELQALAAALEAAGDEPARLHARAALAFRAMRAPDRMLHSGPLREEAATERNEGLAEYSGWRVATGDGDVAAPLAAALKRDDAGRSYVRSAAYLTGPAYGVLLDRFAPGWRTGLDADDDLPLLLAGAIGAEVRTVDAARLAAAYGGQRIGAEESERATQRRRMQAAARARMVEGAVLRLALRKPIASFDPRALLPLGTDGTVYTPLTVRDAWGELVAEGGGLIASDWSQVSVDAAAMRGCGRDWQGSGWRLTLAEGWGVRRVGDDWELVQGGSAECTRTSKSP